MIKKIKRKICLFSGKRGGFGAYLPLMQLIDKDPDLELQILLGDMHTSKEFGSTAEEAKKFFPKAAFEAVEMGTGRGDTAVIRAENLGLFLQKIPAVLQKFKPDILLVHGDRGDHLITAFAAVNLGIPVGHTQGGEVSGNIDDIQRHAITKLAHIHFPETETAAERIKNLGEESWRIYPVGSVYVDRIVKKMYTNPRKAKINYGLKKNEDYFIILFHPDTYETREKNYQTMKNILSAARSFGLRSLVIYPCSDPGYKGISRAINGVKGDSKFLIYKNIENLDFLGLMAGAAAIIGNSSCALVEAPYFKLPAVNVGKRQEGRDREENVVDAELGVNSIKNKVKYVLLDKNYKKMIEKCGYRLGDGKASERILKVLKTIDLNERLLRK